MGRVGGESGSGMSKRRSHEQYKRLGKITHDKFFNSFPERFWKQVEIGDANSCWNWTGEMNSKGYGIYERCKVRKVAHRWAWLLTHGVLDESRCLLHKCDNPLCCNPSHLVPGTMKQNSEDMVKKRRNKYGTKHYRAKLDDEKVRTVRQLLAAGDSTTNIGKRFGVDSASIRDIRSGYSWKHVV